MHSAVSCMTVIGAYDPVRPLVHTQFRQRVIARAADGSPASSGPTSLAIGATGVASNLLCYASLYSLVTRGEGLPPGPGGILGAAEGVSYLVVLGLLGWSVATKANTGSGLPAGEAGLVGAAEGLSYLTLVAAIGGFGYQFVTKGSIPGPLG